MGKECTMLEVSKVPMEKEEEDEFEMSLELSIGGSYAKSKNPEKLDGKSVEKSEFFGGNGDLAKRKEIQALRRLEASKKRMKKSKGGFNNLGVLEGGDDKLLLEGQKFRAGERDCFSGERDGFPREFSAKKEMNIDLNLSLCIENNNAVQGGLYPEVQRGYAYPCGSWIKGGNVVVYESGNSYDDSEGKSNGNLKMVSNNNGSLEHTSSAVSDYQSKGGSNSDTGSHSSPLRPRQFHNIPRKSPLEQPEANDPSSQPEPNHVLGGVPQNRPNAASLSIRPLGPGKSNPNPHLNQTDNTPDSKLENRAPSTSKETTSGPTEKPPKPLNNNLNATSIPRMPCVTTTGNGPNGKTITGILYQYTKTEVSIMCVCHESSFSPAGFVEHAGGVDISHPMRHITIVPPR